MPASSICFSLPHLPNTEQYDPQRRSRALASPSSEKPWLQTHTVKMPTAPWMQGPLLLHPEDVLTFSKDRKTKIKRHHFRVDRSLTDKVRGGRSRVAMRNIVRSITKLRTLAPLDVDGDDEGSDEVIEFSIPLEEEIVDANGSVRKRKVPWGNVVEKVVYPREKKERVVTTAKKILPKDVLRRLQEEAGKIDKWVKAKKAGLTDDVVDEIRRIWKKRELVKVKFRLPLSANMVRAREIVELKTGGLVVWSKRDTLVVYRGSNYQLPPKPFLNSDVTLSVHSSGIPEDKVCIPANSDEFNATCFQRCTEAKQTLFDYLGSESIPRMESAGETLYEKETNRLLDGLGPRFIDWWWKKPLPIDADLLPEVVPDFKTPFRCCPPRIRPTLSNDELAYLRKIARPLPTHFALGKNRKLHGLAAAILKLWEKCPIAKIAVKLGLPNTSNERMSYELKRLTGGVLILRNKFFIILYRGKDFLPNGVASSIFEREIKLQDQQLQEEVARFKALELYNLLDDSVSMTTSNIGTLSEFEDIERQYAAPEDDSCEDKIKIKAEIAKLEKELQEQERKLFILNVKIERSEKELGKLNSLWRLSDLAEDQEILTDEERQKFRKIGLKMDEFLLLGRRGVYDGTIASMHQHWKHRELVKVITMQNAFLQVSYTAKQLEIESGGILVAVRQLRKGHVIILYRGKNYRRPLKLLPDNLLTKREALKKSIEVQRRGSLRFFVRQRRQAIWILKQKLRELRDKAKILDHSHEFNSDES
ncbi:chloroplastic group IIA intron splicing facilitator CRS1, chloroplastic [Dioscorea cayenensis subsp. rotundata]|uniref:Chloroplastic group IIA intron splicing facilitator CRS1, chloroplastic n=1 Tax=Dioscorea cayennensis subsp. rotundata TaxID=55577 RepID=A0AB40AMB2_DIOCR|nr:chloroplastic group IIA intron splicing facilitator CRS1, chloroplastic [Dioscorea cayenensis subsp. rotundata]XP_039116093.1 chloroplastic group IIA intron splicing facilitator CRS1, chloroplastic [Dioscorea cayenensis subsp. rotundata]